MAAVVAGLVALAGCGTSAGEPPASPVSTEQTASATAPSGSVREQRHPDILSVDIAAAGEGTVDLDVTVSSPYDTPERYADGWRVLDPEGQVLGEHTLAHDHASEQPFTRTQRGVEIPAGVSTITVEGRDQEFGYGGGTLTVEVPENLQPSGG